MKIDLRKVNKEIKQGFFTSNDIFVRSDSDGIHDEWFELFCVSGSYTYCLSDSVGRIGFPSAADAVSFFLRRLARPNFSGKIEVIS